MPKWMTLIVLGLTGLATIAWMLFLIIGAYRLLDLVLQL
jgi:hypothetical protein